MNDEKKTKLILKAGLGASIACLAYTLYGKKLKRGLGMGMIIGITIALNAHFQV